MKVCTSCNENKEEADFGVRRASRDGLNARCKACMKAYDAKRYQEQPHRREHARLCALSPAGAASKKRWAERNPEKRAAQVTVGNSIRDGKLIKGPCEICGSEKVHAHHDDYSKPLDVRWLCPQHHSDQHKPR